MYRVLIVDDEQLVVERFSNVLQRAFDVNLKVEKAYTKEEALSILREKRVDIMLLDIKLPNCNGVDVAAKILKTSPQTKLIFLTGYKNFEHTCRTCVSRNVSYLLKTESDDYVEEAIRIEIEEIEYRAAQRAKMQYEREKKYMYSHIIRRDIYKDIVLGKDIEQVARRIDGREKEFVLDVTKPVYQIYGNIIWDNKSESDLYNLYIGTDRISHDLFNYVIFDEDDNNYLWFIQPKTDITNISRIRDSINSMISRLNNNKAMLLIYNDMVEMQKVKSIYTQMKEYTNKENAANIAHRLYTFVIENNTLKEDIMSKKITTILSGSDMAKRPLAKATQLYK